jgi:hypothetical protein
MLILPSMKLPAQTEAAIVYSDPVCTGKVSCSRHRGHAARLTNPCDDLTVPLATRCIPDAGIRCPGSLEYTGRHPQRTRNCSTAQMRTGKHSAQVCLGLARGTPLRSHSATQEISPLTSRSHDAPRPVPVIPDPRRETRPHVPLSPGTRRPVNHSPRCGQSVREASAASACFCVHTPLTSALHLLSW